MDIGRLPPLRSLLAFQTVARCGSFTRAAELLALTQSGISRQIAQLEDHVGAALFERQPSGVVLTRIGEEYAKEVGRALDALQSLEAGQLTRRGQDQVTIACSRAVADLWMLPRLTRLRDAFPGLELKLIVNDFFQQLRHDEYDLAIYYRPNRPADHVVDVLGPEEMMPVMAPGATPLTEAEAPLLLTVEETHKEWTDWGNWLAAMDVQLPEAATRWKLGDYHLSVEAARRGVGIAMGWTWFIVDYLDSGELVPADARPFRGHGQYYLMRPTTRHQRQVARQVGDWLVESNRRWRGA
ncbi:MULTISPECIES: LysR family transcriptional regulator [unclassified Salipiger]|uniref:LysR family transcriptional regulator n=1 Tax=unclassified Salipiger TaxID=2640570 RepID=UPI00080A99F7|nr:MULTISPECIES: LysR family transcriptional regulator [unclassified Salipiger]ANT63356.1 LysR family transcriptional regulator [Salipiger sp. CCB-MM3]ANT63371.1 LysR family transcriptional regulator [Salipiger sp. CCB-MM3]NDW00938.1 LysR family transcriptional regulator [Salipiger sp. PrR002]NDW56485.1 LysR family transcriptional regulator [Salipiger sp. PrR004]